MAHTTIIIHTNSAPSESGDAPEITTNVTWVIPHDLDDMEIAKQFMKILKKAQGINASGS